jgi:putative hemolysin
MQENAIVPASKHCAKKGYHLLVPGEELTNKVGEKT